MKKLSVAVITYNHEEYIANCIESIVSQKTNFDFEVVIGEDCSKDGTGAMCKELAAKYPGIIRLLPSDRNYGPLGNTTRVLNACRSDYVAFCEGDDYWINDRKLQKQVDFLDQHPDFTICFSAVEVIDELGWNWPYEKYYPVFDKDIFTIDDFILSEMNIIPTPTLVFKNVLPQPLPDFFVNGLMGDLGMQLFLADKGKAKFLNEKLAVYRNHSGGLTKSEEHIKKMNGWLIQYYKTFNEYFNFRYDHLFRKRFLQMAKVELIYGARHTKGWGRLRHYFQKMPDYIRYSERINWKELAYYHAVLFFPFLLKKKTTDSISGS